MVLGVRGAGSLVVAIVLFGVGCGLSLYQGIIHLKPTGTDKTAAGIEVGRRDRDADRTERRS